MQDCHSDGDRDGEIIQQDDACEPVFSGNGLFAIHACHGPAVLQVTALLPWVQSASCIGGRPNEKAALLSVAALQTNYRRSANLPALQPSVHVCDFPAAVVVMLE
jgi:hypothetical protein